jgi:multiple sugar transport system permease protein
MKRSALLILPCLVLCLLFSVVPMALSAVAGLWRIDFQDNSFVGFANYWKALRDPKFLGSLVNGMVYAVIVTVVNFGIAIPLGLVVADLPVGVRRKVQTALYVPGMVTGVLIAALWRLLLNPVRGPLVGIFNVWSNRWTAIAAISIIIAISASSTNAMSISVLAASVGSEVREAARIDGAGAGKIRWRIVLPGIAGVVIVLVIFGMIGATQIWETIQAVSYARPNETSGTPIWEIFDTGFTRIQYGLACAKTTIYLLGLGLVFLVVRLVKR